MNILELEEESGEARVPSFQGGTMQGELLKEYVKSSASAVAN